MISRTYFISTVCYHNDGSGSYSTHSRFFNHKSFFNDTENAYMAVVNAIESHYKDMGLNASYIHVLSFNKL